MSIYTHTGTTAKNEYSAENMPETIGMRMFKTCGMIMIPPQRRRAAPPTTMPALRPNTPNFLVVCTDFLRVHFSKDLSEISKGSEFEPRENTSFIFFIFIISCRICNF